MARGQISKEKVIKKILETFPGSFVYDKEVRIPYQEEGEEIQLKCTLTCAKTNVEKDGDTAIPGQDIKSNSDTFEKIENSENTIVKPTEEEKENVARLMKVLGL